MSAQKFGEGPLSRGAAWVYTLLIIELLLLATTVAGLIPLMLLARDASNLPLAAMCLIPAGPAFCAAVYALHHRRLDVADLLPASAFWRGYRANLRGALKIWIPLVAFLTIVGFNLAHLSVAAIPAWWAGLLGFLGAVGLLAGANALIISSLFSFRTRDIARLGLYFLMRTKGVTLGNACLLIVAAGMTVLFSEVVVVLLGSVLTLAVLRNARPMLDVVRKEFTA